MELKEEDTPHKLFCYTCLCVGRNVYKITDERVNNYYLEILDEIPLNNPKQFVNFMVCWECKAIIQKCWSFREQVKDSYRILQSYTNECLRECLLTNIARQPRLKIHNAQTINISPLDEQECSAGVVTVKEELNEDWECSKDNTDEIEDEHFTDHFENNYIENGTELKTELIICSIEREDTKRNRDVKSKEKRKRRSLKEKNKSNILDESLSQTVPMNELPVDIKQLNLLKLKDVSSWESNEDGNTNHIEDYHHSDNFDNGYTENSKELETELQSIISSIEREDKKKKNRGPKSKVKRTKKILKNINHDKKSKLHKYEQSVLTIELSYEEMLLEREEVATKEAYITAEYKCDTCLIGFNYKKSYQGHMKSKHSPELGEYICPICKTIISSVDSFTTHYKRHMRRYECIICHKRTADLKVMQQHFYSSHKISLKEYKCNICGKVSNSMDSHRYHKDSHRARLQCPDCDKTFRHRAGLMNHRHTVHEFQNTFPCNVCDKVFRWKTSLKRHLEKHNDKNKMASDEPYCDTCRISFASICSYQRHMKNSLKHVSRDQLKYICDHCNSRFSDKTKLRDHIEEKHLHKTYQCHICLKPSKNRVGLDQHIRNIHKGRPKNKICNHCGRGFPTRMQLETHIRSHTGERPFICEYCPTTFTNQSNLYKHNRQVHLNIKSKRYPLCKKTKEDGNDQVPKVPIIDHQVENETYRPIVLQYSPERGFVL